VRYQRNAVSLSYVHKYGNAQRASLEFVFKNDKTTKRTRDVAFIQRVIRST